MVFGLTDLAEAAVLTAAHFVVTEEEKPRAIDRRLISLAQRSPHLFEAESIASHFLDLDNPL